MRSSSRRSTISPQDLKGISAILVGFGLLLAIAEVWSRCGKAKPEWTRKLVHFGGGMLCLSLPWLVVSPWAVLTLAIVSAGIILVGRRFGLLHSIHRVNRTTLGSEYYPIAVFLIFLIAQGQSWLFVASMLVLGVADAMAALVGTRYGSITFEVEDERKSVEGTVAFALAAFLAMHLPMLLMTDISRPAVVLVCLVVAILITGFEIVSLYGTDNLFIPVGACLILGKLSTKPLEEITYQCFSLLAFCLLLAWIMYRRRTLNVGGVITLMMFIYGAWSLGSEIWAIPILVSFICYEILSYARKQRFSMPLVRVRVMFRILVIPLLLLIIGNMWNVAGHAFGMYLAAVTTALGLALLGHFRGTAQRVSVKLTLAVGVFALLATTLVPWVLSPSHSWKQPAAVAVACLPMLLIRRLQPRVNEGELIWGTRQLMLTLGAVVIVGVLQLFNVTPPWPHWHLH